MKNEPAESLSARAQEPRARVTVSLREVAIALVVLGIGIFMVGDWVRHPDGHTLRRLATGVAAVIVGSVVTWLSFRRTCSACGGTLRTFSFRAASGSVSAIVQALTAGDVPGSARLFHRVFAEDPQQAAASCRVRYCDGCRQLLVIEKVDAGGGGGPRAVTGRRATAVVPIVMEQARQRLSAKE